MPIPLFQVDAFTDIPFTGNPAAVCLLDAPAEDTFLQNVAAEMNLAETAFLLPPATGGAWGLRWFTPAREVVLCGHATLASARVLFDRDLASGEGVSGNQVAFDTLSGRLETRRLDDDRLELDLPSLPAEEWTPPIDAFDALGIAPDSRVASGLARLGPGDAYGLIELADEAAVRAVSPDFRHLFSLEPGGWIVTARAAGTGETAGIDVVSRFFAPRMGIDEDPVTGSAHGVLVPWWAEKLGLDEVAARQISARGGTIHGRSLGDRVALAGHAVTVFAGELLVEP